MTEVTRTGTGNSLCGAVQRGQPSDAHSTRTPRNCRSFARLEAAQAAAVPKRLSGIFGRVDHTNYANDGGVPDIADEEQRDALHEEEEEWL